jgi:hypothetical protein
MAYRAWAGRYGAPDGDIEFAIAPIKDEFPTNMPFAKRVDLDKAVYASDKELARPRKMLIIDKADYYVKLEDAMKRVIQDIFGVK